VRTPQGAWLTPDDFKPLMANVLAHHPGLEFLAETSEFQSKYSETVVYRIFYTVNRSGTGRMTLKELRRSDLLDALDALDAEDDINKVGLLLIPTQLRLLQSVHS
jgi:serine/threonine-protein phosphatase 2A regulatory subunit B''